MKRQILGVIAAVTMAAGVVLAQSAGQDPQYPSQKSNADVSVTGCLVQGSAPEVFLLNNARTADESKTEKGKSYLVVALATDVHLPEQLNHEVKVTGTVDQKSALPTGASVTEKSLPRFSAKTITMVSDRCESGQR